MTCKRLGYLAGIVAVASAMSARVVQGQRTGIEIWAATCGNCHIAQPANRYTAKDWDAIGTHMSIAARLTDAQATAVIEFLKSNAMQPQGGSDAAAAALTVPSQAQRSDRIELTPEQIAALAEYVRQLRAKT